MKQKLQTLKEEIELHKWGIAEWIVAGFLSIPICAILAEPMIWIWRNGLAEAVRLGIGPSALK